MLKKIVTCLNLTSVIISGVYYNLHLDLINYMFYDVSAGHYTFNDVSTEALEVRMLNNFNLDDLLVDSPTNSFVVDNLATTTVTADHLQVHGNMNDIPVSKHHCIRFENIDLLSFSFQCFLFQAFFMLQLSFRSNFYSVKIFFS